MPALCDDGDPCTRDECVDNTCRHPARTGIASVTCSYEARGLQVPLCAGETIPASLLKKLTGGRQQAGRAAATTDLRKAKRAVKKSDAILRGLQSAIRRLRAHHMSPTCADQLAAAVDSARAQAERWLSAPSLTGN